MRLSHDPSRTHASFDDPNLVARAGLIPVMALAQRGVRSAPGAAGLLEMGGRDTEDTDHMVTEAAIRAFYAHYRKVMGY